jgi:hypothetical protein
MESTLKVLIVHGKAGRNGAKYPRMCMLDPALSHLRIPFGNIRGRPALHRESTFTRHLRPGRRRDSLVWYAPVLCWIGQDGRHMLSGADSLHPPDRQKPL